MKAELIKRQDRWDLYSEDGHKIASTVPNSKVKLSLKNCEAIANGYDLDELAKSEAIKISETEVRDEKLERIYKRGFQKALEILGDKKFSEEELKRAMSAALSIGYGRRFHVKDKQLKIDPYIQLMQQTEWNVEIEQVLVTSSIEGEAKWENKLDNNGCLILKRYEGE